MKLVKKWLIYGANGYTGKLIAEEAARRGQKPILAGRNEQQVIALAEALELPFRVFDLQQQYRVRTELEDCGLVLNCAGPFSRTSDILREACLDSGCHYLDITGEMDVLQKSYDSHDRAVKRGIVIISGVGFDVVPTDIIAAILKDKLPNATNLEMAFAGESGISPGTAKTLLQDLPKRGSIREQNQLKTVPLAWKCKTINFSDQPRYCMSIPWGDLVTAWENTHIPNITIYTAVEASQAKWMRRLNPIVSLLKFKLLQKWFGKMIEKNLPGPDENERSKGFIKLWGEVTDGKQTITLQMDAPEGYNYTVMAALMFVESLVAHQVMPGAYTPTQALPIERLLAMEGVSYKLLNHEG